MQNTRILQSFGCCASHARNSLRSFCRSSKLAAGGSLFRFARMQEVIYEHLRRRYPGYLLLLLLQLAFTHYFELAINVSDSLPGTLYIIQKGTQPTKGGYAAFHYQNDFLYHPGSHFLKRVAGQAGDIVTARGNKYHVNGKFVGEARTTTRNGFSIEPLAHTGIIPAGRYYMMADNPYSLDSRYAVVGLVTSSQIIGAAYRVF